MEPVLKGGVIYSVTYSNKYVSRARAYNLTPIVLLLKAGKWREPDFCVEAVNVLRWRALRNLTGTPKSSAMRTPL